jgi:Xaa-Pro aminopeptidase
MTDFPAAELEARSARARELMSAAGLDALLLTGVDEFCYFVGVPTALYQTRRPWCLILPREAEPIVITLGGIIDTVRGQGGVADVRPYAFPASNLAGVAADALREVGAQAIGVELGLETRLGVPVLDFDAIRGALPDAAFADASALLWQLRKIKSPLEVERMRKACAITAASRQRLFGEVRVGMSETEIAERWAELMREEGAERPSFIYINSGVDADFIPKPHRRLNAGDTLWVDGGVYVQDYTCDFNRIATMGPASELQRRVHGGVAEIMQGMLDLVEIGRPLKELGRYCAAELAARGLSDPRDAVSFVGGHSMGRLINEPPLIADWDHTVITEGLVAGLEFGPALPEGLFVLEDMIWVTADGYELLTDEPWDLVEIDL